MESIVGVSGGSALDHFQFTDVRFGMRVPDNLDAAAKWENDRLMQFHPDKCSVMHITTKRNPIHHKYVLHQHTLFGMRVPDTATVF
jgi:hypothetical protein